MDDLKTEEKKDCVALMVASTNSNAVMDLSLLSQHIMNEQMRRRY